MKLTKIFNVFFQKKYLGLFVLFCLIAASIPGVRNLKVNLSVDRLSIKTHHQNTTASSTPKPYYIFAVVTAKEGTVLNPRYLSSLSKLIATVKEARPRADIKSLFDIKTLENTPNGLELVPLIKNKKLGVTIQDAKKRIHTSYKLIRDIVAKDLKSSTVVIKYHPKSTLQAAPIFSKLNSLINSDKNSFHSIRVMSVAKPQSIARKYAMDKGLPLLGLALLIMLLIIGFMSRNVKSIPVLLFTILCNIYFSLAFLGYMGWPLNIISIVLPFLIIILGSTEGMHLVCAFLKAKNRGNTDREAIDFMINKIYPPTIITTLTTAVGFYTFSITQSLGIREFALSSGSSMLICGLFTMFFLPLFLAFLPLKNSRLGIRHDDARDKKQISNKIASLILSRSRVILMMLIVAFVSFFYISSLNKVNHKFFNAFVPSHPFSAEINNFRDYFGGFSLMTINISTSEPDAFLFSSNLTKLSNLCSSLEKEKDVSSCLSFSTILSHINMKLHNDRAYNQVPKDDDEIEQLLTVVDTDTLNEFVNSDFDRVSIKLRFKSISLIQLRALVAKIKQITNAAFGEGYNIHLKYSTKSSLNSIYNFTNELFLSIIFCISSIFLLFCIQYRSVLSGVVAIFANLFPVSILLGFMYLVNIPLNPLSLVAVIIILSVGVDDTVHFFSKYAAFATQTSSNKQAVINTVSFELLPISISSLSIILGMLVLSLSSILTMHVIGLLLCVGMIFAFFADILINPVLLSIFRVITLFDYLSFQYSTTLLSVSPMFKSMSKSEIKKAVLLSEVTHLQSGEQLIKQGEPGNSMYIVLEGELDVYRDSAHIARLKPGNVVGEMAYFSEENRTADVIADGDVSLVVFNDKAQRHSMRFQKKMYLKLMRNAITIILKRLS